MTGHEALGWIAAALTLLTFISCDMIRLRVLALLANVAFVLYAMSADLGPILALHVVLAPINLWRLLQLLRRETEKEKAVASQPAPASESMPGSEHLRAPPPAHSPSRDQAVVRPPGPVAE